ncbi:uncharacterized protein TNCV_1435461 [Trichonephila clavipes]|nr:uncharacterized protein TNCV_1435461 [Trichonephila clavipes]
MHHKVLHGDYIEVSVKCTTKRRKGLQHKHPCLTRDSNQDPTAPQSALLTTIPDRRLSSLEDVNNYCCFAVLQKEFHFEDKNTVTNFAQLKAALSKAFPAIRNKKDLEIKFYASQQKRNQEPTDFIYDLLKLHKQLELGLSEEALVDHIFVRLEPQVQAYVKVQNSQNMVQLLEVLSKFEERYSCKTMQGSGNSDNVERRGWNERRISNVDVSRRNWRNSEVLLRPSNDRNDIGVITRMVVKEISGWTAGIDFRGMIEDLTIEDTNLEMRLKMTILVEGTAEIEVRINRGLHVLHHEIDTGDKPPVVSHPYRYDRVKQAILDYHVEKILLEGIIIPIQSPYASPVVLCRKNNGLTPDNPKVYRFAVDYRKLNSIIKYPRYPLQLIDDLITNIPPYDDYVDS